ncbi:MAG: uroporphyrinogen decarboxylase [Bdellovibrionales bacterium]|nr:uroporphyrinogen decarboxylase [Bdellovibrionales bacterium]
MTSTFLDAVNRKNKNHIPVLFMRQAGRYLPEYMKLKDVHSFRTRTHTPELMTEITLQPMRRYKMDAAIMFSDILTCLEYMGAAFDFTGEGPKLATAGVSTLKEIHKLDVKDMSFVYEGIKKITAELTDRPLVGFVGAPFTLCSYIIEGGTSKEFLKTKNFMYSSPKDFHKAMEILAESVGNYLAEQMRTGVEAVQVFDSWVGFLNEDDYRTYLLPHMKNLVSLARKGGKPIILYSQPASHLLPALKEVGADVYSIDWRMKLADAAKVLGDNVAIQGNLDPAVTTLEWSEARPFVDRVLEDAKKAGIRDRYIFNVGHGVNPTTKPETVGSIVEYVHSK